MIFTLPLAERDKRGRQYPLLAVHRVWCARVVIAFLDGLADASTAMSTSVPPAASEPNAQPNSSFKPPKSDHISR
jgi:hypothetical protein